MYQSLIDQSLIVSTVRSSPQAERCVIDLGHVSGVYPELFTRCARRPRFLAGLECVVGLCSSVLAGETTR